MILQSVERLNICHACPHFIRMTTTCKKCGCFMIAKIQLKNAHCPLKKW
jgi:hypothetical protein